VAIELSKTKSLIGKIKGTFSSKEETPEELDIRRTMIKIGAQQATTTNILMENIDEIQNLANEGDQRAASLVELLHSDEAKRAKEIQDQINQGKEVNQEQAKFLIDFLEKSTSATKGLELKLDARLSTVATHISDLVMNENLGREDRRKMLNELVTISKETHDTAEATKEGTGLSQETLEALDKIEEINKKEGNFTRDELNELQGYMEKVADPVSKAKLRGTLDELENRMESSIITDRNLNESLEEQMESGLSLKDQFSKMGLGEAGRTVKGGLIDMLAGQVGLGGMGIGAALTPLLDKGLDKFKSGISTAMGFALTGSKKLLTKLTGGISSLVKNMGAEMLSKTSSVLGKVGKMTMTGLSSIVGGVSKLASKAFLAISSGLSSVIAKIGAMGLAQKAQAAWTGVVTAAQWLWNAAMTANPIGLIVTAVGALIAAGVLLYKNWDKVSAALEVGWEWMKKIGTIIWDNLIGAFTKVWEWIKVISDKLGNWKILIGVLMGPIGWLVTAGVLLYKNWNKVIGVFENLWEWVKKITTIGWESITSLPEKIIEGVSGLFGGINEWLEKYLGEFWTGIKAAFSTIFDYSILGAIFDPSAFWDRIKTLPGKILDGITGLFTGISEFLFGEEGMLSLKNLKKAAKIILKSIPGIGKIFSFFGGDEEETKTAKKIKEKSETLLPSTFTSTVPKEITEIPTKIEKVSAKEITETPAKISQEGKTLALEESKLMKAAAAKTMEEKGPEKPIIVIPETKETAAPNRNPQIDDYGIAFMNSMSMGV